MLNLTLSPWIVLTELRETEFNRRINLFRGLGRFNLGLALIGFRTTGLPGMFLMSTEVLFIQEVSDV